MGNSTRHGHRFKRFGSTATIAAFIIAVFILGATSCGDGGDSADDTTSSSSNEPASTTESTTETTESNGTTEGTMTEPAGETVDVFFSTGDGSDCGEVRAFPRSIGGGEDPTQAAFTALVGGPTDEEAVSGAGSMFSADTTDAVTSVTVQDGLLVVDFTDLRSVIPNASTSCGSMALLGQLNATAFQFDEVDRTRYTIEGSCDDFANWLQRECFETDRNGQQLDVPTNERASGSGCTPATADTLTHGRWFGFVDQADADTVDFDLACWFTGTAAAAAASEDGEESPPPNDYHIRNDKDQVRTLDVDPSTDVTWLPNPGDPATAETIGYDAWVAEQPGRDFSPGVWLTVEDGAITGIEEQYVP
jgi:hypothetical protein